MNDMSNYLDTLTDDDLETIDELKDEGYSAKKIAGIYGLPEQVIRNHFKSKRAPARTGRKPKVTIEVAAEWRKLFDEGRPIKQIAELYGESFQLVYGYLRNGHPAERDTSLKKKSA